MPPIAEFSGESQSPVVATYTSCFPGGGVCVMLPFSGGEAVAKDSLEAGLAFRHRAQLVPNDTASGKVADVSSSDLTVRRPRLLIINSRRTWQWGSDDVQNCPSLF
ncbi:BQ5605_C012g06725 [Microbotryum silenes-dioicae]|uniref:BQ5605_C012g06725 protein n=1 Tax=Microbotryum silenes-dioicae TaxID=796604 RepID=A0A2X0LRT3_9BASI|nr:BQ5605_C012g06725 [Microbotryum silenes-dioicae]